MNKPLVLAEESLLALLKRKPDGVTMPDVIGALPGIREAELRAAVWTLRAGGEADFAGSVLKAAHKAETPHAADRNALAERLVLAVATARPALAAFERSLASSLSSDSRSHDEDRGPRKQINEILAALAALGL